MIAPTYQFYSGRGRKAGLREFTVYSVFKRNGHVFRDRVSLIAGEKTVSYERLLQTIDRLACGPSAAGIAKGDRIAVIAQLCVPVRRRGEDWRGHGAHQLETWSREVKYVISHMSPRMIFASDEFQPVAASLSSEFGSIRDCYSMDNAAWEFAPFDVLTEAEGVSPPADVKSDDAYVVLDTAAVDGRSRGAILSHRGLVLSGLQITGQP